MLRRTASVESSPPTSISRLKSPLSCCLRRHPRQITVLTLDGLLSPRWPSHQAPPKPLKCLCRPLMSRSSAIISTPPSISKVGHRRQRQSLFVLPCKRFGGISTLLGCDVVVKQAAWRPPFSSGCLPRCSRFRFSDCSGQRGIRPSGSSIVCAALRVDLAYSRSLLALRYHTSKYMIWLRVRVVSKLINDSASAHFFLQLVSTHLCRIRGGPYRAVVGEPASEVDRGNNHVVVSESAFAGCADCECSMM